MMASGGNGGSISSGSSSGSRSSAIMNSDSDDEKVTIEVDGGSNPEATARVAFLREALQGVQNEFLRIEKFANVNTTACYKILKKHDKMIPATVCCRYYLERLHQQPWIRTDHSAVFVVQIADLFTKLRSKKTGPANDAQGNGPKVRKASSDRMSGTTEQTHTTDTHPHAPAPAPT